MKNQSYANRGRKFEDFLKLVHAKYQRSGLACIHKVPTEFLPIRDARGRVASCKVEEKSCVDYLGRYRSVPVAVEAKHEQGDRILFSRVEEHQAAYLNDFTRARSAVGIVLVSFGMRRFFAVPWDFWRIARDAWENRPDQISRKCAQVNINARGYNWTTPGKASVSADELLPQWEIRQNGPLLLPYLNIIDELWSEVILNDF